MVNLSLTEKGGSTNELSFDKDEVSVGRVRGNDIVLSKGNVSKHHCRLIVRGGEVFIEDLRSTNGTYVNGRKIAEPTPVSISDKIFVGDFILRMTSLSSSMEMMRSASPPGPPEAGSLSSALPRRPPPPPPSARGGSLADDALDADPSVPPALHHAARGPIPPPPPPPIPGKRESRIGPAISDPFPPSSGPSDINLDDDDDSLSTPHPHFTVPPLRPAVQPMGSLVDVETPGGSESSTSSLRPTREHGASSLAMEESPPPEAPSADDDDRAGLHSPPEPEDVFGSVGTTGSRPKRKTSEPSKPAAMPRPKPAHQAAGKHGSRLLDRDFPEWLAQVLEGEGVTAAFFTGTNQAEVQRNGRRESASVPASDLAALGQVIRKLANKGSPKPAPDAAAINTTLPDGTHIAAIFPPVADRLCVAVRCPVASGKTVDDLVEEQVISPEMRQVLDACVASRQNILVAGDRAACDSLLRAILWSVDRVARVALLSDSIAPPASATSWIKLQPEPQPTDLVAAAVAMQPEYLIVDANHSALAGEVLSECNLGLDGVILAVVARSTSDALHRLQVLTSSPNTIGADMVVSCIDLVIHASVLSNGSMKVVEMAEPKASLDGQVSAHALLTWIPGDDNAGSFTVTGAHSSLAAKLSSAGSSIPPEILNRQ